MNTIVLYYIKLLNGLVLIFTNCTVQNKELTHNHVTVIPDRLPMLIYYPK